MRPDAVGCETNEQPKSFVRSYSGSQTEGDDHCPNNAKALEWLDTVPSRETDGVSISGCSWAVTGPLFQDPAGQFRAFSSDTAPPLGSLASNLLRS
jgi:hypothetical protein